MYWTKEDSLRSRANTYQVTELAEQGVVAWEQLARDLMGWMSDTEVGKFARANDLITDADDEEEDLDD